MLVFAASDKGGTGRSVTSANLAYQRALTGDHRWSGVAPVNE